LAVFKEKWRRSRTASIVGYSKNYSLGVAQSVHVFIAQQNALRIRRNHFGDVFANRISRFPLTNILLRAVLFRRFREMQRSTLILLRASTKLALNDLRIRKTRRLFVALFTLGTIKYFLTRTDPLTRRRVFNVSSNIHARTLYVG